MINESVLKFVDTEVLSLWIERAISERELALCRDQVEIHSSLQRHLQALVIDLKARLAGHHFTDTEKEAQVEFSFVVPDGIWQEIRKRYFPSWWIKRHPIKWKNLKNVRYYPQIVRRTNVCPHLWQPAMRVRDHLRWLTGGDVTDSSSFKQLDSYTVATCKHFVMREIGNQDIVNGIFAQIEARLDAQDRIRDTPRLRD